MDFLTCHLCFGAYGFVAPFLRQPLPLLFPEGEAKDGHEDRTKETRLHKCVH